MAAAGAASQLTETVWPEAGLTRVPLYVADCLANKPHFAEQRGER